MLSWAITFFILAIIAGIFGFGGLAGTLAVAAKWLFVAFVILFAITAIANIFSNKKVDPPY